MFIKASPEADLGRDHQAGVHDEVLPGGTIEGRLPRGVAPGRRTEIRAGPSEVLEYDPPRRLVHEWRSYYDPELAAEEPSRVTWEVEQQDGGYSLLTVVHDQLEGAPKTAENVSGTGWMMVLSGIKTLLETGRGPHRLIAERGRRLEACGPASLRP